MAFLLTMRQSYVIIVRKDFNSCQENKSFRSTLFQKGRGVWGSAPQRHSVRSARGEFRNSPVDCFWRGAAVVNDRGKNYFAPKFKSEIIL